MRLIDRRIGIRVRCGIGVGDRDAAKPLPRDDAGRLAALEPERIRQRIVLVGIAVWPTVDGDGQDVARGVEAAATQRARELPADAALDRLERRGQQLHAPGAMLQARLQTGLTRCLREVQHDGLVGGPGAAVGPEADRRSQAH